MSCCDSCMFGDGSECPNQAYSSQWKAINLRTGKALVQEDFTNYHWNYNGEVPNKCDEQEVSNAESNMESNAVEEHDDDLPDSTDQTIDWDELYDTINTFTTFEQLQQYVENYEVTTFPSLMKPILNAWRTQRVDQVAKLSMPQDVPKGLVPISTIGDGNCFAQAVSTALFGNQNHHKEIRM